MFGFMKKATPDNRLDEAESERLAASLSAEIAALEQRLASNERDGEAQKQLMVAYNRALSLFARSRLHRDEMDALFVKMDALRNIMRKSI
ncbi:hypothetical protein PANNVG_01824 [Pantoea sp. Nvir]|uniref:hypothetical protein n=1 Tax=Pantoea TaxID=53335 RepID=UPI000CDD1B7B|nr:MULTISPECIES: hypothetical protein [Pantoea]MCG7366623.1 hypothetical protein [Pantoea sp. ACRSH]MCG7397115.1 hypothetical protein [Pantoea sp. ACRSC]POW57073.1 hypothetical protein C3408_12260 [Pantoea alvi]UBN52691.1 hypothetical protein LB453_12380 [Pantoea agglomerans]